MPIAARSSAERLAAQDREQLLLLFAVRVMRQLLLDVVQLGVELLAIGGGIEAEHVGEQALDQTDALRPPPCSLADTFFFMTAG